MKVNIKKLIFLLLSTLVVCLFAVSCTHSEEEKEITEFKAYFIYTEFGVSAYEVTADNGISDVLIVSSDMTCDKLAAGESGVSIQEETAEKYGFVIDENTVTITSETRGHKCQYFFTGTCSNGNVFVEKNGSNDIEIELINLNLTEPDEGSCPLWIKGGSTNVVLKIKEGTTNVLTDASHVDADGNIIKPKACINVSENLTIEGSGELTVNGNNKNGIKSDSNIEIGGTVTLNVTSVDDGIHSDGNIAVTGGTLNIKSGDDGLHADGNIIIGKEENSAEPKINITECFEGIEGLVVDVYGGDIDIISSDDGINAVNPENKQTEAADGDHKMPDPDAEGFDEQKKFDGENMPVFEDESDDSCNINIFGGDIYILSGKDSLDSNGNITISGGNCVLFASSGRASKTSDGLDACGTITFAKNGGTVFAASPIGMMQKEPESEGATYTMGALTCEKDDKITIDDDGFLKEYNMDCSNGFILYTSPTFNGGNIENKNSEATLVPGTVADIFKKKE